jgi:hypothetical protein
MTAAPPAVRNLFRAALVIFVITVVIGILNGTDVWDPPRNTLLTHVHAGTLGWITLSVFGGAFWMLGRADDESSAPLARYSIVALSLYVFAFWSADLFDTTETIQRPIGGTLAFIAIVWMFVWAIRQKRGTSWNVAEFGIGLALLFLVIGAILGILLGLQLADVEIVAAESADQLGGAHPAAMVIGYVVLASIAIIEWLLRGTATPGVRAAKAGVVQMSLLFLAGLFGMLGLLLDVEPLLLLNVPFQVTGILIVLWRLRHELAPSRWRGDFLGVYLRTAVLGLVLAVVQTANVIRLFVSGGEDEEALFEMRALHPRPGSHHLPPGGHQHGPGDDGDVGRRVGHGQPGDLHRAERGGGGIRRRAAGRELDVEADLHPDTWVGTPLRDLYAPDRQATGESGRCHVTLSPQVRLGPGLARLARVIHPETTALSI